MVGPPPPRLMSPPYLPWLGRGVGASPWPYAKRERLQNPLIELQLCGPKVGGNCLPSEKPKGTTVGRAAPAREQSKEVPLERR